MIPLPTIDVLDSITIPVACPVPWDTMHGDHRTRFCNKCSQNVHDISELTTAEAVQLVTKGEKTPCLRLFRRPDGRVMTADCMTKRDRAWKWLRRRSTWAAALFALVFMAGCGTPTEIAGDICFVENPIPDAHNDEHSARQAATTQSGEQVSRMNPAAEAESHIRHEGAAAQ
jgi:hypothetical protein